MKVLIDIPSNYKERLDKDFDNINTGSVGATSILMAVKEGIEIPENATNGDMIKAIFPNIKTWDESEGALCVEFKTLNQIKIFPKYWWNAPYDKEVK